ncbi:hypothetical protein A4A49_03986 [Nicotiana attenuata]|uniref:Transmembrane protein n=1 Tax=Nicotiana attenuata TaxID=49451 RepID=A0A1J6IAS4_NICAT|nr:hypothetical protein A4A49_03986 [Nicotiana attenuata]
MEVATDMLPLYNRPNSASRTISIPSWFSGKWIHLIPLAVFLCLLILWWFSYPVMLEIRDGRIKEIHKIEVVPELLNETTNVDLTILAMTTATASAPFTSNIPQKQEVNESEAVYEELIKIHKVYNNEPAAEPMSNNNG